MKYKSLIDRMSLEEKAALLSGKNEWQTRELKKWHIPNMNCADGPHGLRKQAGTGDHLGLHASLPATCFPTAACVANSWDEKLAEEIGQALGEEARALDVQVLLGPGLNIKRSPLCGRNFEYFSEDPYLSGKMSAAYVRGIQSKGVYSCIKHFAANSQEERRMASNSVVDERTLREIYLTAFEIAVREGKAKALMSAYNEVNGVYANENTYLLQEVLRRDWGFEGIVITDWGGSNDHVAGVAAGSDLEMPNPGLDSARILAEAVRDHRLSEEVLNERVDTLLRAVFETTSAQKEKNDFSVEEHHRLARKAAAKSIVLLENQGGILPLLHKTKVALIGDFAFEPRYQGAGSSLVNSTKVDSLVSCIGEYENLEVVAKVRGYERTDKENEALLQEALEAAAKADVVLLCFGLDEISESEGLDRKHLRIPKNQLRLIEALHKQGVDLIGIISAGSVIEMPWKSCFKGLLHSYLSGQAGAGAVLDVLSGRQNPCGKLAESYPLRYEDTPAYPYYPGRKRSSEYREALYVGYRYYDSFDKETAYPFGYGLSYTQFAYRDLLIEEKGLSFTLENTGTVFGEEIVQLYIGKADSGIFRAKKELKAFRKIALAPGESTSVHLLFDDKSFRYWNVESGAWEREGGIYRLMVGADSKDIRLEGELWLEGSIEKLPYRAPVLAVYDQGDIHRVSDEAFAALLGREIPKDIKTNKLALNDPISRLGEAKSFAGRMIFRYLERQKKKAEKRGKPDLNILFVYNMPFRALAKMSGGKVSMEMAEAILDICNGGGIQAYRKAFLAYRKNRRENRRDEARLGEEA